MGESHDGVEGAFAVDYGEGVLDCGGEGGAWGCVGGVVGVEGAVHDACDFWIALDAGRGGCDC